MKTIHKYGLEESTTLQMPIGAEILSTHGQGGDICIWALVDTDHKKEDRNFVVIGTGHPIPDLALKFIGTALLQSGLLVFHVFEVIETEVKA